MHKKMSFLRVFQKIAILVCVFCAFFISPVFATLPAGYTELEYITCNNSWIDLPTYGTQNTAIECKALITSLTASKQLFGSYTTTQGTNLTCNFVTSATWQFGSRISQLLPISNYVTIGTPFIVKVNNQSATIDGETILTGTTTDFTTTNKLSVGRANGSTAPFVGNIYYYIQKDNGVLTYHLIPAKRNSDNAIGMYDTVSGRFFTNAGTGSFVAGPEKPISDIQIATTKFVDEEFKAAELKLAETVETIEEVVSNTITQTEQIATLQSEKQTRPNETCPAGKKCLLVMDENDIPHWYEIIEAVYDFVANWFTPFNNAGKPTFHYTTDTSSGSTIWTSYNGFYKGDSAFRKNYIDGSTSTYDRPFAHATRCNAGYTRTTTAREADMCYPETGVFKTLTDGEWAIVYNGDEGSSTKKVPASVVYGTSKCTSVAGPNNYATSNPTKFSELTPEQQAAWLELPALHGQPERAGYNSDDYKQCWCKMTALGIPNSGETIASGQSTAGTIYPLPESSSAWVFRDAASSAADCANYCALYCARNVRDSAGCRAAVLSWQ